MAVRVIARGGEIGRLVRVVLVAHLADDLLDDVLQRDDTGRAAVLVDHHGHRALAVHPVEQPVHRQRLGYEQGLAEQLGDGEARPALHRERQHVLDVGDADDLVEAAPVDREA